MTERYRGPRLGQGNEWARVRIGILARDGWRCRLCGRIGPLDLHHDPPVGHPDVHPHDPDGIVTLCRECHAHRHHEVGDDDIHAWIARVLGAQPPPRGPDWDRMDTEDARAMLRRLQVADLVRGGVTLPRDVAREVGCGHSTAELDLMWVWHGRPPSHHFRRPVDGSSVRLPHEDLWDRRRLVAWAEEGERRRARADRRNRQRRRRRARERWRERTGQGLCGRCGRTADGKLSHCRACLDRLREWGS